MRRPIWWKGISEICLVDDVWTAFAKSANHHRIQLTIRLSAWQAQWKTLQGSFCMAVLKPKIQDLATIGNLNKSHRSAFDLCYGINLSMKSRSSKWERISKWHQRALWYRRVLRMDYHEYRKSFHLEEMGRPWGVLKTKTELFSTLDCKWSTVFI